MNLQGLFQKAVYSMGGLVPWIGRGPFHPHDPAIAVVANGGDRGTGLPCSPAQAAMQLSTAWACVKLASETPATLPIEVHELQPNGRFAPAREHPLWGIVHDSPNSEQTAVEFWESLFASKLLWGCGYAEIDRGYRNRVNALMALRPDGPLSARVRRDGSRYYEYTDLKGNRREIEPDNLLRIPGWLGLSAVAQGARNLGLAHAQMETARNFYEKGMKSSGFLEYPGILGPEEREKFQDLLDSYTSGSRAGSVMILEGAMTYKALSIDPVDAALLTSRQFEVEEICRWYGVPPVLVGHGAAGSSLGSSTEQVISAWIALSLRADVKRIEGAIARRLLAPGDRGRFTVSINLDALMRADARARADFLSKMVQNGLYSRNEGRAYENKPPKDDPMADELTVQGNLIPLSKLPELGGRQGGLGGTQENPAGSETGGSNARD